MGHYGYLKYGGHHLAEFKNGYFDRIVGHYFQKTDYIDYTYLTYEDDSWTNVDSDEPFLMTQRFTGYRAVSDVVLQRLAIFNKTLDSVVNSIWYILIERIDLDLLDGEIDPERDYLSRVFSKRKCKEELVKYYPRYLAQRNHEKFDKRISRFGKWLLSYDGPLDNLGIDELVICAIHSFGQGSYLEYDLDDLVFVGYDDFEDEELINPKITVLTEGKSDARIISRGFEMLKPEVKDYFHVIDFEGPSISGGASYLTHAVKVFAGCNIAIPIVAIFDNDTAGKAEILKLSRLKLPSNIHVCQYPVIDSLREYPCMGYNGMEICNVNGRAGSIEMYLGHQSLTDDTGQRRPIIWSSFDKNVCQYQGALEHKNEAIKVFERISKSVSFQSLRQFEDLRKLLDVIERAFLGNDDFVVPAVL